MKTVKIGASCYWNETEIVLEAGHKYTFLVEGTWSDASIECDADGYPPPPLNLYQQLILKSFSPFKRAPSNRWFALIGAIDKDMNTAFLIGRSNTVTVSRTGRLTCFANDVPFMYWNNSGAVVLTVSHSNNE